NGRFAAFVLRDRSELARLFRQGRRPQSRRVVVWDWPHKRRVSQFDLPPTWDLITSEFVLSPDGKFLAVGGSNREPLNLFDTESGQVRYTLRDSVCAPAFSPDGRWLITACAAEGPAGAAPERTNGVQVRDTVTGQVVRNFAGDLRVASVVFS